MQCVKSQLRSIQHGGLEYGLVRYLSPQPKLAQVAEQPQPEVSFLYLGKFDQGLTSSRTIRMRQQNRPGQIAIRGKNALIYSNSSGTITGGRFADELDLQRKHSSKRN